MSLSEISHQASDFVIAAAKESGDSAKRFLDHASATLTAFLTLGAAVMGWDKHQQKLALDYIYNRTIIQNGLNEKAPEGTTIQ